MSYTYEYPRPALTVDAVVFSKCKEDTYVLLIERKHDPFGGYWAFPGGFVNMNENCETAVARELKEETGLGELQFEQVLVASEPERDPRGRTVSIVYVAHTPTCKPAVSGYDDAAKAQWFSVQKLPQLAFDHGALLHSILQKIKI